MKNYRQIAVVLLFILVACFAGEQKSPLKANALKVEIRKENDAYKLYRAGKPYDIKGAVAWSLLDELIKAGGNSVRGSWRILEEAHRLRLTVLVNLPMAAERDGFDYDDAEAVRNQFNRVKALVETNKDHPAVLMWAIGNELDHIPGDLDYNLKVWDAVNEVAGMIKQIDTHHPVMTVVGYGRLEKLKDIAERCPNLDLLGINAYANLVNVPKWLREYNWNKPYVVTEWGPSGWWEVPRTRWGLVIEETSTEKARVYRERYQRVILTDPLCIGSYVFLWATNRQERTHTWFNMFHDSLKTETIEVMQYQWTGTWPKNRAPRIESLTINGKNALENIELAPSSLNMAQVIAIDPDNDQLKIEWELLREPMQFAPYAGQGETKPKPVEKFIFSQQNRAIQFQVPLDAGMNYRLFVYVHDGQGNIGVANIPFYVSMP